MREGSGQTRQVAGQVEAAIIKPIAQGQQGLHVAGHGQAARKEHGIAVDPSFQQRQEGQQWSRYIGMGHWRVLLAAGADGPPGGMHDEAQVKVRRREPEIFVGLGAEAIE
ncbi:hypothetical protein D3C87_1831020 [compost metagenome]